MGRITRMTWMTWSIASAAGPIKAAPPKRFGLVDDRRPRSCSAVDAFICKLPCFTREACETSHVAHTMAQVLLAVRQ